MPQLKNHLRHWGTAIVEAHNVLVAQDSVPSTSELMADAADPGHLFKALCEATVKSDGLNMLRNVLHAVFHLQYLLGVSSFSDRHALGLSLNIP
jgi:hypothetical protein